MSIGITRPTVAPVPGDTILGQKCIVALQDDVDDVILNFRGTVGGFPRNVQTIDREVPNAEGVLEPDRTNVIRAGKEVRITVDEFPQGFLDRFYNKDFVKGNARVWIGDPEDEDGTSRLMTNNFNCLAYVGGDLNTQADQYSTSQVTLRVNGTFSLTKNADSES